MRLRSQLVLVGCVTAFAFGGGGIWVFQRRASEATMRLLDDVLATGHIAVERQWKLRNAERHSAFRGITAQPYLRAYLRAGDAAQMGYFTAAARRAGADAALIIDDKGQVLSSDGEGAAELAVASASGLLNEEGVLLPLGGRVANAWGLAVGGDQPAGRLLVAARVDEATLRADTVPLGVEAAVVAGDAVASSFDLDPGVAAALRGLAASRAGGGALRAKGERHRARVVPFGGGSLIVAVPQRRVDAVVSEMALSTLALLVLALLATGAVALFLVGRITRPIERLKAAADRLSQGDFDASAAALSRLVGRRDEIGALASAWSAAIALRAEAAATSGRLSLALRSAVEIVERAASSLATGAQRQEARLHEVQATLQAFAQLLDASATRINEAAASVRTMASSAGGMERSCATATSMVGRIEAAVMGAGRRPGAHGASARDGGATIAEVEIVAGALVRALEVQRRSLLDLAERAVALRHTIDESLSLRNKEREHDLRARLAMAEIGSVARGQVEEAVALRASAEALREAATRLAQVVTPGNGKH